MAEVERRNWTAGPASRCPCGLGQPYGECCGRFHRGPVTAPTAELLMRSRFSAFAVGDVAYLLRTWHPTTRPHRIELDPAQRWTHLDVLHATQGGLLDPDGTVDFRAHYRLDGRAGALAERSEFVRHDGLWVYLRPVP